MNKTKSNSISRGSPDLPVAVGRISKPHGVTGEMKFFIFFAEAVKQLVGGQVTLVPANSQPFDAVLESTRGGSPLIARLSGIESPEQVKEFCPALVTAPKGSIPSLPNGKWYFEEIIGLPVFDLNGKELGKLVDFFAVGDSDVWVIDTPEGEEILTPCIPETLQEVDLEQERIVMTLLEEI